MNIRSVAYVLGWVLQFESAFLLLPMCTALIYGETQGFAYLAVALCCLALGSLIRGRRTGTPEFYAREGFVATAASWVLMSVMGALPFVITGEIPAFIDALFETVSGFTTTGASILSEVESMSHTSLMWRSFTHWIGGMGVLVFLLAVLPLTGGRNMQLMKAESPGPSVGKLVPRVRYTAQILYRVYIVLTVLQFTLLVLGRMPVFEAICTSFGTAGTGGFGVKNDSLAGYSPYIQWVTTVFMIVFGINFNVYFLLLMRKFRDAAHCEEMRWYLGIIGIATLLIFANTFDASVGVEAGLRTSAFQVASIISTTGFSTTDFNVWPMFSKMILLMVMFLGACAGSTGGGFKVSRLVIGSKTIGRYLNTFLHSRAMYKVRFEGKEVDAETRHTLMTYFFTLLVIMIGAMFVLSLENLDFETTFTAALTTISNVGPGLGGVGPANNFGMFSPLSKAVMIFEMLAGRLELFPVLMLLYPPLWRESRHESERRKRRDKAAARRESFASDRKGITR